MSQRSDILRHLRNGGTLTPIDALEQFGCMRLAPRIQELRSEGWDIQTLDVTRNGKTYACYKMRPDPKVQPELFAL